MHQKYKKLGFSIFFDLIGMLSYTVPALGEFSDLIWAPISALLMTQLYKGTKGKIGAVISFTEEILPFDFIPSFTLLWIYTYFIGKEKQ